MTVGCWRERIGDRERTFCRREALTRRETALRAILRYVVSAVSLLVIGLETPESSQSRKSSFFVGETIHRCQDGGRRCGETHWRFHPPTERENLSWCVSMGEKTHI